MQHPHIHIETPPRWTCAIVDGGEISTTNIGFTAIVQPPPVECLSCHCGEVAIGASSPVGLESLAFRSATTCTPAQRRRLGNGPTCGTPLLTTGPNDATIKVAIDRASGSRSLGDETLVVVGTFSSLPLELPPAVASEPVSCNLVPGNLVIGNLVIGNYGEMPDVADAPRPREVRVVRRG